jgi:hypothetical protein
VSGLSSRRTWEALFPEVGKMNPAGGSEPASQELCLKDIHLKTPMQIISAPQLGYQGEEMSSSQGLGECGRTWASLRLFPRRGLWVYLCFLLNTLWSGSSRLGTGTNLILGKVSALS